MNNNRNRSWPLLFLVCMMWTGINDAKAAEILVNEISRNAPEDNVAGSFACPVLKRCDHRVVGLFRPAGDGRKAWVVRAVPNEDSCHACTSKMTLLEYRKTANGWKRVRSYSDFTEWGTWGKVRPQWVSLARLKDGRILLLMRVPDVHFGVVTDVLSVYVTNGDSVARAGIFSTQYDTEGYGDGAPLVQWQAAYGLRERNGRVMLEFHIHDRSGGKNTSSRFILVGNRFEADGETDKRLSVSSQ